MDTSTALEIDYDATRRRPDCPGKHSGKLIITGDGERDIPLPFAGKLGIRSNTLATGTKRKLGQAVNEQDLIVEEIQSSHPDEERKEERKDSDSVSSLDSDSLSESSSSLSEYSEAQP